MIMLDFDAIDVCGKQEVSLRGHSDDSNTLDILEAFTDRDPVIKVAKSRACIE